MSLETNSFKFSEFLLDAKEKVLLRDGKPLSITPKAFQLLQILVENHGHLVERNVLLNAVWEDSFVEEGNLTFTVRLLRKLLGDSKQNPRFIETVPKRGYRFIAEVEKVLPETQTETETAAFPKQTVAIWTKRQKFLLAALTLTFILTASIGIGSFYVRSKSGEPNAPILAAPYSLESISTNGKVPFAAISPDGKWVVYAVRNEGKQSVWLRQLDTGENIEIIPPTEAIYYALEFSPDGNYLYFTRQMASIDVYRMPVRGGIPTKVVSDVWRSFSLSADGNKIAFHRRHTNKDEYYSLWIADGADGKNERKTLSTQSPNRIGGLQISPDGKQIAFAVGQSENSGNDFGLKSVDIETGVEREITKEKFFNIKGISWLPDQSGLLFVARRNVNRFQIWQVSTASGEVQALTKDAGDYGGLSLDKSGNRLVSTQTSEDFRLQLRNLENPSVSKVLINATRAVFAPDGKIIFYSSMTGNTEIWSLQKDGSGQRQLTNNPAADANPIASPTDGSIFFVSNRTGEAHVWRMNPDGSNQTQITKKEGGFPLYVSPDGKWIYYHHGINRTLWRIPTNGGTEELILNKRKDLGQPGISPDGTQVAFPENQAGERFLQIISLTDEQIIKNLPTAAQKGFITQIAWLPDGKSLAYIHADNENKNPVLWLQTLDGKEQKITDLGEEEIFSLKFAPDGKNFLITQGGWRHDAVLLKGLK